MLGDTRGNKRGDAGADTGANQASRMQSLITSFIVRSSLGRAAHLTSARRRMQPRRELTESKYLLVDVQECKVRNHTHRQTSVCFENHSFVER